MGATLYFTNAREGLVKKITGVTAVVEAEATWKSKPYRDDGFLQQPTPETYTYEKIGSVVTGNPTVGTVQVAYPDKVLHEDLRQSPIDVTVWQVTFMADEIEFVTEFRKDEWVYGPEEPENW